MATWSLSLDTHTGKQPEYVGCQAPPKPLKGSSFGIGKAPSSTGGALAVLAAKEGLCGRGDMSIASGTGPGEEEGIGGVILLSNRSLV